MTRLRSDVAKASTKCLPPSTRPASSVSDATERGTNDHPNGHITTSPVNVPAQGERDQNHDLLGTRGQSPPTEEINRGLESEIGGLWSERAKRRRAELNRKRLGSGARSEPVQFVPDASSPSTEKKAPRNPNPN